MFVEGANVKWNLLPPDNILTYTKKKNKVYLMSNTRPCPTFVRHLFKKLIQASKFL